MSTTSERVPLRVTLDASVDAAYVYLRDIEPGGVHKSVPVREAPRTINLDFDKKGRLIGIEVLDASRSLPTELLDRAERI